MVLEKFKDELRLKCCDAIQEIYIGEFDKARTILKEVESRLYKCTKEY